jgi:hypothetical protein
MQRFVVTTVDGNAQLSQLRGPRSQPAIDTGDERTSPRVRTLQGQYPIVHRFAQFGKPATAEAGFPRPRRISRRETAGALPDEMVLKYRNFY